MASESGMKRLCDAYIRNPCLVGFVYGIVPPLIWLAVYLSFPEWRSIYLVRVILALVVGGVLGAGLNRFGLSLWLIKHRSPEGPASVLDGTLIGAAIGCGSGLLPPLTNLIQTNHPSDVMTVIIISWVASCVVGGIFGSILAVIGRTHVERPAAGGGQ